MPPTHGLGGTRPTRHHALPLISPYNGRTYRKIAFEIENLKLAENILLQRNGRKALALQQRGPKNINMVKVFYMLLFVPTPSTHCTTDSEDSP